MPPKRSNKSNEPSTTPYWDISAPRVKMMRNAIHGCFIFIFMLLLYIATRRESMGLLVDNN